MHFATPPSRQWSTRKRGARSARWSVSLAAVVAGALLAVAPRVSHAEQFVLFDATFSYTWDDAINAKPSKSHFYVNDKNFMNKERPANFMAPINYRDGTIHIHYEVLEKPPGTQQAGWALCYVANVGNYGCPYTDYYTKTGVYEKNVDMHNFYNNTTIQWDRGIKQVDLVYTINGSGSGHISNFPALKDLVTPTRVRIVAVQVAKGSTYDPSILGMTPAADGGADASAPVDAAALDTGPASNDVPPSTPEDPPAGSGGAGGAISPTAGTGGSSPSGGTGGQAPGVTADGGCVVAPAAPSALASGWLLALGLSGWLARRRRR
jgi:hypothetical protein